MKKTLTIHNKNYLSELWSELPSNVLLNKGITGCGGTYLELNSKRNSIILVPTKELVKNKSSNTVFGLHGNIKNKALIEYLQKETIIHKKIIGTYDALPRIMEYINPENYFLLIDEYHLMFNQYTLRNEAIYYVLNNYNKFKNFCFMTATPLKKEMLLVELEHLNHIEIEWTKAVPVKIDIKDIRNSTHEIVKLIKNPESKINYHIFLNSVTTIRRIVKTTNLKDYKVVCSDRVRSDLNIESTLTPPKKFNFYTATAFEGCDIYDEMGKTIILCDTGIASTILDISTLVRQISGRIRNSIYKDEIKLILNTSVHRYAGTSNEEFQKSVKENERIGKRKIELIDNLKSDLDKEVERRSYSSEKYNSFYVNYKQDTFFFDENLKKRDIYNYSLISEIYNNSISVIKETINSKMEVNSITKSNWAIDMLEKKEYSYEELENLFKSECKKRNKKFNGYFINTYFDIIDKNRRMIDGKRMMYYTFKI